MKALGRSVGKVEGDKGRVEREQQGGQGDERGEVLVLKTALDLREDMKVDEALLYESISLLIVFIFFTWRWPEVQAIAV